MLNMTINMQEMTINGHQFKDLHAFNTALVFVQALRDGIAPEQVEKALKTRFERGY